MLESWKVQNSPTSVSRYLHVIQSIYWMNVKAGLLHCSNSINNVVFSPNYMTTLLVEQLKLHHFLCPRQTILLKKRIKYLDILINKTLFQINVYKLE